MTSGSRNSNPVLRRGRACPDARSLRHEPRTGSRGFDLDVPLARELGQCFAGPGRLRPESGFPRGAARREGWEAKVGVCGEVRLISFETFDRLILGGSFVFKLTGFFLV